MSLPDPVHWLGHLALFGGLAAALGRGRPPAVALAGTMAAGLLLELVQAATGTSSPREALFDLAVDALSGMAGLALRGRREVSHALGVWLHPAVLVPLGLLGSYHTATRDLPQALGWTLVALCCWLPAAAAWAVGTRLGRFTDADLVDRRERPALFALGCGSATLYAAVARLGGPASVVVLADGLLLCAVTVTLVTAAGFKVSGHVAVPLLLAAVAGTWSVRAAVLLLAVAVLLSWARVRAGVHRPVEVAGAWLLGLAALGLPALRS
jgi:hypothetical protein